MQKFTLGSIVVCALFVSTHAQAQTLGGHIEGFGGTTFGTSASAPTFGGSIAVPLGDNLQLLGEGGRLTDIKASLLDTALDFTPLDVGMSAPTRAEPPTHRNIRGRRPVRQSGWDLIVRPKERSSCPPVRVRAEAARSLRP